MKCQTLFVQENEEGELKKVNVGFATRQYAFPSNAFACRKFGEQGGFIAYC